MTIFICHKKRACPVSACPLAWPTYGREHQRNLQRSYRSIIICHNVKMVVKHKFEMV